MPSPDVPYFDVTFSHRNHEYLRHSMHHEFYHLIEYNLIEYNSFKDFYYKDPDWNSLNSKDFTYGKGGASAYSDSTFANEKHPFDGFVTEYSTYGLEEDKAEIYT